MSDQFAWGAAEGGTYSTSAPNPHVDLDGASPDAFVVEQLFGDVLSNSQTCTVTVYKDRDNWATYRGATYTTGSPNIIDLSTGTALDTKGTLSNTDTVVVLGLAAYGLEEIQIACSNGVSPLTTGTAKVTFRMPFAMTLTAVRASVSTAPTGATLTVDINESGTTILSTKLTIDATEETSTTAATAAVISDSALADDAEITIDIDQVGSTVAGVGLVVTLIGYRA